jgi:hypothetical protein
MWKFAVKPDYSLNKASPGERLKYVWPEGTVISVLFLVATRVS